MKFIKLFNCFVLWTIKSLGVRPWIILPILLWSFQTGINLTWLNLDHRSPGVDEAVHLNASLDYYQLIRSPSAAALNTAMSSLYPPLFQFTSAVLYLFLGSSLNTAYMTNSLFTAILIISLICLGRQLYSLEAGILSAAVVLLYPAMIVMSHEYWLDYAAAAMSTLALCSLVRTRYFSSRKWSIAAGIVFGLGLLTRQYIILVLAGPVIWTGIQAIRKHGSHKIFRQNIAIYISVAFLIAIPYYLFSRKIFLNYSYRVIATSTDKASWWKLPWLIIHELWTTQLNAVFLTLATMVVLTWLIRRDVARHVFLLICLTVSILLFSILHRNLCRYTMGLLPVIALVTAQGIYAISTPIWRRITISAILIFGIAQYILIMFPIAPNGITIGKCRLTRDVIVQSLASPNQHSINLGILPGYTPKTDHHIDKIAKKIKELMRIQHVENPLILVIANGTQFSSPILQYYLRRNQMQVSVTGLHNLVPGRMTPLEDFNYVLVGPVHPASWNFDPELVRYYQELKDKFLLNYGDSLYPHEFSLGFGQSVRIFVLNSTSMLTKIP